MFKLRNNLRRAFEFGESRKPLITNEIRSSVAEKQADAEKERKASQLKEYKQKLLSPLANEKNLARHGWGIGNIRKYGLLNKSKISGKWKLFLYTYRTKDQVIERAARVGRKKDVLNRHRDAYSRAIPGDEFEPRHIGKPKPTLPDQLEIQFARINNLDGSKYREKFLAEQTEYMSIENSSKDLNLLQELSKISSELDKKLTAEPKHKNPRANDKKTLATNYTLMLSFAIHGACKDAFASNHEKISEATVIAALDYLKKLPLLGSVTTVNNDNNNNDSDEANSNVVTPHIELAWRIAYKMAATSTGFDMLKKINTLESESQYTNPNSLPPVPPGSTEATEDKKAEIAAKAKAADASPAQQKRLNLRRDENIRLFMQGADALLQDENPTALTKTDPASLLTYCKDDRRKSEPRKNVLLINALQGLQTILRKNEQATQEASPPDPNLWAAYALRNGFLSDAVGSPFSKANERLEKVSLQVTRGLRNQNHAETVEKRIELNLEEQKEASSILPRIFKRNRGKTPFNRNIEIDIAANSVLLQREKMVATLRLLDKILCSRLPREIINSKGNFNGDELNKIKLNKFILETISQIIYIRAWAASNPSEILDGRPLSSGVADKLHTDNYLFNLMGVTNIDKKSNIQELKKFIHHTKAMPLTPKILKEFFDKKDPDPNGVSNNPPHEDAGNTDPTEHIKDIPDQKNITDMRLDQCIAAYQRAWKHLDTGKDDVIVAHDNTPSREDIATYLNDQTQRMRLASSIKFSDGASVGFGLSGLTAVVARVLLGGAIGVRANFSYRRSRVATVEIGVNTTSGFARFGTETNHITRSGAGGSFGWALAKFKYFAAGTGAYVDGKRIYDPGTFTGVTLRLDRLGQDITGREGQIPGVSGDADMTVVLGKTVEQVIMGHKTSSHLLKDLLVETPQLSVCWVDEGDSTTREQGHIAQAGVLLGTFANGAGVGSAASVARTHRSQDQEYEEQTGALRSRGIVRGERTSISGHATALGVSNLATLTGQSIVANETVAIAEILGADAEIYRDGTKEEIRTIEYQGQIQPRSFKLIIHTNAEAFASSVEPNIEEWGQRFVQVKEPHNYFYDDNDPDPEKVTKQLKATREQAGIVRDLTQEMRETADPNTSYVEFLELEEATTIEINRYRHMAKMAGLAGAAGEKERVLLEDAAERLLKDPTSYVRRFLFSSTTRTVDEGRQINLIGSFASTTQFSETVIRNGYAG